MGVHRELVPVEAEHEDTRNGLFADTLEPFQLRLDLLICALPQMLQAALSPL